MNQSISVFEAVTGWLFFLTFVCFCFCFATLRYHVDAAKLTNTQEVDHAVKAFIPKREVLTKSGLVRYNLAIVSLLVSMATAAAILVRNMMH